MKTQKQCKQMKLWVYIYENKKGDFKIALATSVKNITSVQQLKQTIVYLRPFEIPFDAIAHKYLLDYLSKETVLKWIDKHKEETKKWLKFLFESDC